MEIIRKSQDIEKHELIAFINIYDTAKFDRDFDSMPYKRNDIAVNHNINKLQIYVTSNTKDGLKKFIEDYPHAETRGTSYVDNPEEWEYLAFGEDRVPDDFSTLDRYFHGRGKAYKERQEQKMLKEKNND